MIYATKRTSLTSLSPSLPPYLSLVTGSKNQLFWFYDDCQKCNNKRIKKNKRNLQRKLFIHSNKCQISRMSVSFDRDIPLASLNEFINFIFHILCTTISKLIFAETYLYLCWATKLPIQMKCDQIHALRQNFFPFVFCYEKQNTINYPHKRDGKSRSKTKQQQKNYAKQMK